MLPFRLVPFTPEPLVAGLELSGFVTRDGGVLRVSYHLSGELSTLVIAESSTERSRKDNLWRDTCFEFFAAAQGQPSYHEVNLSPSGAWQAYAFTGYREGMALLPVTHFSSTCDRTPNSLLLSCEILLEPLAAAPSLDISVTAILEHAGGSKSYWALTHAGERPDFHLRNSFILCTHE